MTRPWLERFRPYGYFLAAGATFAGALMLSRAVTTAGVAGRIGIGGVSLLLGLAGIVSTVVAAKHAFTAPERERNTALIILLIAVLAVLNLSAILVGVVGVVEQLAQP